MQLSTLKPRDIVAGHERNKWDLTLQLVYISKTSEHWSWINDQNVDSLKFIPEIFSADFFFFNFVQVFLNSGFSDGWSVADIDLEGGDLKIYLPSWVIKNHQLLYLKAQTRVNFASNAEQV